MDTNGPNRRDFGDVTAGVVETGDTRTERRDDRRRASEVGRTERAPADATRGSR